MPAHTEETFDTLWSFETDGELHAPPVVEDELVVVGDADGTVYAVDALDGRVHWQTDLAVPTVFASPAVVDDTVLISGFDDLSRADSTTYALDLASGEVQWARDFGQGGRTAVKADDERVYVETYDGTCHALSIQTGETVWDVDGERSHYTSAITDGTLLHSDGDTLVAVDAETGSERWRTPLGGRARTPSVVNDGRVYVIAGSSEQWCLDVATGDTRWRVDIGTAIRDRPDLDNPLLPLGGGVLDGKPVTDGDSVLVSIYEGLVELDAVDGRIHRYHPLRQRIHDPLLVGDGDDHRLFGHVWHEGMTEFRLDGAVSPLRSTVDDILDTVPAYAAGVFYLGVETGSVRAVR